MKTHYKKISHNNYNKEDKKQRHHKFAGLLYPADAKETYGLTEQERCVYEGSMARIVCSMRFNPTNCLEALEKDRE
ncbi:hypothetical protein NE556_23570, partial [[Clostridium] symbiosum]